MGATGHEPQKKGVHATGDRERHAPHVSMWGLLVAPGREYETGRPCTDEQPCASCVSTQGQLDLVVGPGSEPQNRGRQKDGQRAHTSSYRGK